MPKGLLGFFIGLLSGTVLNWAIQWTLLLVSFVSGILVGVLWAGRFWRIAG
jgi:hypothetical protein